MATGSIYVGNLSRQLSQEEMEEALEAHFNQYGEILSYILPRDRDTDRLRGFGFIEFLKRGSIFAALDSHEALFEGRTMIVKLRERPERREDREQLNAPE